jgi:hypothetical protein
MPAMLDQLLGGHALSWTSVEFICGARHLSLMTALSYEHAVEEGQLRGTGPFVVQTTRGTYTASGSMTLYIDEANELRNALLLLPGLGGYLEKRFTAIVTLAEPSTGKVLVDTLEQVRLTSERVAWTQGGDPLAVEFGMSIRRILKNGKPAVLDNTLTP